jgi:actin-related protein 8
MIYREYLKRDDQILPLRLLQEERRNRMTATAKDRDRALARAGPNELPPDDAMDIDDDAGLDEMAANSEGVDASGSKIIVIHPGSQNLRIGFASDALPKSIPMVIAKKWRCNEWEETGKERPKRIKLDDGSYPEPEKMFGPEVCCASYYQRYIHVLIQLSLQISIMPCALNSRYICDRISVEFCPTRKS